MISYLQSLLAVLLISSLYSVRCYVPSAVRNVPGSIKATTTALRCKSGSLTVGSTFNSPDSVSAMMKDVATAIIAARDAQISIALVDVPVPVTGNSRLILSRLCYLLWLTVIVSAHGWAALTENRLKTTDSRIYTI